MPRTICDHLELWNLVVSNVIPGASLCLCKSPQVIWSIFKGIGLIMLLADFWCSCSVQCPIVQLSKCPSPSVQVPRCPSVRCPNVHVSKCPPIVQLSKCPSVHVKRVLRTPSPSARGSAPSLKSQVIRQRQGPDPRKSTFQKSTRIQMKHSRFRTSLFST